MPLAPIQAPAIPLKLRAVALLEPALEAQVSPEAFDAIYDTALPEDFALWPVLDDLRASKEAFVAGALKVPDDRFAEGRAAARILETTGFGHYAEHIPWIEALVKSK